MESLTRRSRRLNDASSVKYAVVSSINAYYNSTGSSESVSPEDVVVTGSSPTYEVIVFASSTSGLDSIEDVVLSGQFSTFMEQELGIPVLISNPRRTLRLVRASPPPLPALPPHYPPDIYVVVVYVPGLSDTNETAPDEQDSHVDVWANTRTLLVYSGNHTIEVGQMVWWAPQASGNKCASSRAPTSPADTHGGGLLLSPDGKKAHSVELEDGDYVLCIQDDVHGVVTHSHVTLSSHSSPPSAPLPPSSPSTAPNYPPDIYVVVVYVPGVSDTNELAPDEEETHVDVWANTQTLLLYSGNHTIEEGQLVWWTPPAGGNECAFSNAPTSPADTHGGPIVLSPDRRKGHSVTLEDGDYVLCMQDDAHGVVTHSHVLLGSHSSPPSLPPPLGPPRTRRRLESEHGLLYRLSQRLRASFNADDRM